MTANHVSVTGATPPSSGSRTIEVTAGPVDTPPVTSPEMPIR